MQPPTKQDAGIPPRRLRPLFVLVWIWHAIFFLEAHHMGNTIFTEEERAALAQWSFTTSLTQAEFCEKHRIGSPRTLRQWRKRWPSVEPKAEREVRAIIENALSALQGMLRGLDAAAASREATPAPNGLAPSSAPTVQPNDAGPPSPQPAQRRPGNFFADPWEPGDA